MKARFLVALAIATALFAPAPSGAQQHREGVDATVILNEPVQSVPGKRIRVTQIVIEPGKDAGAHTHPGDEYGIVLDGTLMLKRGDADYEPAGYKFSDK
jgi:quercetin dioxygenase-like cupin family protein